MGILNSQAWALLSMSVQTRLEILHPLSARWLTFNFKTTEDWDRDLKVTYKSQMIYIGPSLFSANIFYN